MSTSPASLLRVDDAAVKAAASEPLAQLAEGLNSGGEGDRVERLQKFLRDGPPDERHRALKLAFASGDPELQILAIKTVIEAGRLLPVVVPDDTPASSLATVMRALRVRTGSVNADSGRFDSGFFVGGYGKLAYGSITSSGVIIKGTTNLDGRERSLTLSLRPDRDGNLVGKAFSDDARCLVMIPLL